MTQKEKGYVGLGAMLVLAAGTVLGSGPLYKAIDTATAEKVSYTAGTYVGTAQGFGGNVTATVTVTDSGIESVALEGTDETPALGGAALEQLGPVFVEANSSMVDAVAGATISSNAAMEAVQQALDQASGKIAVMEAPAAAEAGAEVGEESGKKEDGGQTDYTPGTYEGTAQGFGGEVKAVVTVTDKGIETVELTGDDETPALGGEALKQLPALFVEAQSAQIDGVSGSTITSTAAMEAVQEALEQAK